MPSNWVFIFLMIAGGALLSFQGPINAALGRNTGPLEAALVSFLVGTLALAAAVALFGKGNLGAVASTPKWQLVGGLLGALYVTLIIVSVPKLGVTAMMVSVLLGQLAAAIVIDHFGWFGVPVRPVGWNRLVALPMVMGAVWLMNLNPKK